MRIVARTVKTVCRQTAPETHSERESETWSRTDSETDTFVSVFESILIVSFGQLTGGNRVFGKPQVAIEPIGFANKNSWTKCRTVNSAQHSIP